MSMILQSIGASLLAILKIILLCIILTIPTIILVYIFKKKFLKLRKKKSYLYSISIIIYFILLAIELIAYFLPIIISPTISGFWNWVIFSLLNIIKLAIYNLLITGIFIIFAFITTAIFDLFKEKIKYFYNLVISLTIVNLIIFILLLIFPKLPAMVIYLIY